MHGGVPDAMPCSRRIFTKTMRGTPLVPLKLNLSSSFISQPFVMLHRCRTHTLTDGHQVCLLLILASVSDAASVQHPAIAELIPHAMPDHRDPCRHDEREHVCVSPDQYTGDSVAARGYTPLQIVWPRISMLAIWAEWANITRRIVH